MATKRNIPDILEESAQKNDWHQLLEHIQANPAMYIAGVVFVVACIVAGGFYRVSQSGKIVNQNTSLAKALIDKEKPADRVAELEKLTSGQTPMTARALFMLGAAHVEAKEYDKAKEAFERLRTSFPNSEEVPNAVESLGFLAENSGDYEKALASYKEIVEKWPASFARRHQDVNIGRCEEKLGKLAEAVKSYQALVDNYAGSGFEADAKEALDRLRTAHPELFPKPTEEAKPADAKKAETPAPAAAPAPAASTPAPAEAPAPAAAPAEPAPAK